MDNFALIIGAMKCGTSSLFYYLSEHPQIAAAKDKEPHFFSYKDNFSEGIDWYRHLWNWKSEHHIALEASTTYTMHPKYGNVAARISSIKDANFKFIYIVRHPFARIESHIRHLLSEEFQDKVEVLEEHLAFTEYAKQLDLYREIFGRDRLHIVVLEDLQNDATGELHRICKFLEIDSDYEFQRINTIRNSKETLNLNPQLRHFYKNSVVKYFGNLISPEIRQKFYGLFARKDPYNVKLSDIQKELIIKRLQPDLVKLVDEYGINVNSKWRLP